MTAAPAPASDPMPIGALLAALGRSVMILMTETVRPIGIKPRHIPTLMALRAGPLTQQALGDAIHTDPTQLVVLLNELEGAGLVSRRRDAANRRRHIVELSAAGLSRLAEAETCVAQTEERLLSGIDAAERGHLRLLLARLMANTGSGFGCDPVADDAGC